MNKLLKIISSGNCILVLGDLWRADSTATLEAGLAWLHPQLLKVADAENDEDMTLSEALTAARLADPQATNRVISNYSQITIEARYVDLLQRLLGGPFERIYNLANPWLSIDVVPGVMIEWTDASADFEPHRGARQLIQLCGTTERAESVDFAPPVLGTSGPRMQWFTEFAADAVTRPLLVVAEGPHAELWDFLRVRAVTSMRDLDVLSSAVLVVPPGSTVSKARMQTLGIEPEAFEAKEFADLIAPSRQEVSDGQSRLRRIQALETSSTGINLVDRLIHESADTSWTFLKGEDPLWSDVSAQRLARLGVEKRLREAIRRTSKKRNIVLVKGRAGAGKTALLMQLAAAWSRRGEVTGWIDRSATKSVGEIVDESALLSCDAIFIDDIDIFGYSAPSMLRKLNRVGLTLVVASIRTTQLWAMSGFENVTVVNADEILSDRDLERLLMTLESAGLLGSLLGVNPPSARIDRLREICQRDLLAALLEVVTGEPFERRIGSEFSQLDEMERDIYGLVSFYATHMYEGTHLPASDLLRIVDASPPFIEASHALRHLVGKRLLVEDLGGIRVRHRAIADALLGRKEIGPTRIASFVERFLRFYVGRAAHITEANHPDRRQMIKVLNHSLMIKLRLKAETVREIYARVQPQLQADFHFWLQRGSYEVENGVLDDGERYLVAARALPGGATDYKVATEWGRARLRKAMRHPDDVSEQERAAASMVELERICRTQGTASPHTFTIVMIEGSQWLSRETSLGAERRRELAELVVRVRDLAKKVGYDNGEVMRAERDSRIRINALSQEGPGRFPAI